MVVDTHVREYFPFSENDDIPYYKNDWQQYPYPSNCFPEREIGMYLVRMVSVNFHKINNLRREFLIPGQWLPGPLPAPLMY
jgi:hypothetical protein